MTDPRIAEIETRLTHESMAVIWGHSPADLRYLLSLVAEKDQRIEALEAEKAALWREADNVMKALTEYGASIVPHLLDTDDNAGQRLRDVLAGRLPAREPVETQNAAP